MDSRRISSPWMEDEKVPRNGLLVWNERGRFAMPVLPLEPFLYPEELFREDGETPDIAGQWWVLHTRPRAEKALARKLRQKDVSFFLPLLPRSNRSNGR